MFKFRLQRVLDLRLQREQEVAQRLAEAQGEEERMRQACVELESARDEGVRRVAGQAQPTVGQLQNLRFVVERLNQEITQARQEAVAAAENTQRRMLEFTSAFQERRMLDRLRERDHEGWARDEVQADRQVMDGIALARFVRRQSPAQGGQP